LDVTVEGIGPVLFSRQDPGSPYLIEFVEVSISGTPRALEHAAIAWVMGRELKALDLAPTDRAFVECYLNSED
jgi:hypothetical protein